MTRALLVAALALGFCGCFNVDKPVCSYACATSDPKCPEDYECRTDGYCHRIGTTDACLFSDAAMPGDMNVSMPSGDMATGDLASGSSTD